MIKLLKVTTVYPAPVEGEDYCPEGLSDVETVEASFSELVDMMREYEECSSWPCLGDPSDWLVSYDEDCRTGERLTYSLHFASDNDVRLNKYWGQALRFAGYLQA